MGTFLDRSKGDLLIDTGSGDGVSCVSLTCRRAGVQELRDISNSMPTRGVVLAEEIVRIMERYKLLVQTQMAGRGKGLEG
jgi:hypothetical protein